MTMNAVAGTASLHAALPGRHRDGGTGAIPVRTTSAWGGADRPADDADWRMGGKFPALLRRFEGSQSLSSGLRWSHGSIEVIGPSAGNRRSLSARIREASGRQMGAPHHPGGSSSKDAGSGTDLCAAIEHLCANGLRSPPALLRSLPAGSALCGEEPSSAFHHIATDDSTTCGGTFRIRSQLFRWTGSQPRIPRQDVRSRLFEPCGNCRPRKRQANSLLQLRSGSTLRRSNSCRRTAANEISERFAHLAGSYGALRAYERRLTTGL